MNKFTKYAVAVVAAIMSLSGVTAANAGVVTHTVSIGPALLDWNTSGSSQQVVSLPQFNPADHGGALPSGMEMSFEGVLRATENVQIRNFSTASSPAAFIDGTWDFSIVGLPGLLPNFSFSTGIVAGPFAVAGASDNTSATWTDTVIAPAGTEFAFSGGPDFFSPVPFDFIGAGLVSVQATNEALIGFSGLATSAAIVSWFMEAEGTLTVSYFVPGPAALALLGFGLIGVGALRRRKAA